MKIKSWNRLVAINTVLLRFFLKRKLLYFPIDFCSINVLIKQQAAYIYNLNKSTVFFRHCQMKTNNQKRNCNNKNILPSIIIAIFFIYNFILFRFLLHWWHMLWWESNRSRTRMSGLSTKVNENQLDTKNE